MVINGYHWLSMVDDDEDDDDDSTQVGFFCSAGPTGDMQWL